jgi:hypothetical protein
LHVKKHLCLTSTNVICCCFKATVDHVNQASGRVQMVQLLLLRVLLMPTHIPIQGMFNTLGHLNSARASVLFTCFLLFVCHLYAVLVGCSLVKWV